MKKRIISLLLCVVLMLGFVPSQAFALTTEESGSVEKPTEITTAEGESIPVEDSWEEAYPYGVFLFTDGEVNITEGGEETSIMLYRLGGTQGRASAYVYYNPTSVQLDEDRVSFATAAGCDDVYIIVEDTLPVARYQPLGKPPEPEATEAKLRNEPYAGEDAQAGDRVLTVDAAAERWQWEVLSEGAWKTVEDATGAEFVVGEDMLAEYDFRCVFTKDGVRCCTDSLGGAVYEKAPEEVLPEQPKDLDLMPPQSFSPLVMDPENPYDGYVFEVTFADGEWVKEIRVSAPEDEISEPVKLGTFTLIDHLGGDVLSEAATLTLTVRDNDAPEPFAIGFTEARYDADKAGGSAVVRLKRTGGNQTMVTVDYETVDGTAVAGKDYQTVKGTALFYAGVDEAVIEIPLIDDGTASDTPRVFGLKLGELKGDSEGLCTLTRTETDIALTNSGAGGAKNLVSMLFDAEAVDASGSVGVAEIAAPVSEAVVTGEAVEIPEEELLRGEIAGFDDPAPGQARLMTYNYGEITFSGSHNGNYWGDTAYVAGQSHNDITGWSGGSASGNGWEIKGKSPAKATLTIPYMTQMYSGFYGRYEFNAKLADSWDLFWFGMEYVYGHAAVTTKKGSTHGTASSNPQIIKDGVDKEISYTTGGSINTSWGIADSDPVNGLKLELSRYDAHNADNDVYSRITSGSLTRRTLNNNLRLRIHTANDGESGNGNVATAPAGAAALTESSGVYANMKPEVTIVPNAGGVSSGGRLYVGSKLKVSLQKLDSFKPLDIKSLNTAVYVSRSDGSKVEGVKVERSGREFFVTLLWDGMTDADLRDTYTINVVLTRSQDLLLDLTPSVPRKTDADGYPTTDIDPNRVAEAWSQFRANGDGSITVGYSGTSSEPPYFQNYVTEREFPLNAIQIKDNNPIVDFLGAGGSLKPENIQYINFHRRAEDKILYNNKIYDGDQTIWLSPEDLAFGSIRFYYYSESSVGLDSTMTAAVVRTELYFDGDGDGKITGSYQNGYFTADEPDSLIMMLEENESYNEINFQPEKLENGRYGEYFLKIYYSMIPRNLTAPIGREDAKAQVLPAFTTSITSQAVYATLTEEQQSYRYILSGVGADGARTSDNHVMYGAEASAVQFVDVPLGGDRSPVESEEIKAEDGTATYIHSWSPDFRGNLIYPFSDPEPITIAHSLAGDDFPLAKVSYEKGTGVKTEGKANLNGYLGSFVGDSTIALCVTEQKYTADQLKADQSTAKTLQPESSELIRRSVTPDAAYLSDMNPSDMGGDDTNPSDSGNEYAEMLPDAGIKLPMRTFGALGYATVVTNKDEIILTVSVPLFNYKNTNGTGYKSTGFPNTIKNSMSKQFSELKGFFGYPDGTDKLIEGMKKNNYTDGAKAGSLKSKQITYQVTGVLVVGWKYDAVQNSYLLREIAGGAVGSVAFKYTYRFAMCPLVFVYVSVNFGVTVTFGATYVREEQMRAIPFVNEDRSQNLKKGAEIGFSTKYQNVSLQFNGKLYVEVLDQKGGTPVAGTKNGYIKSDGGKRQTFRLSTGKGMEFSQEYYVHIVALEDTAVSYLNVIEKVTTHPVFTGVKATPKLTAEFGAGAGIDLIKVEACIKFVASTNLLFLAYNEKTGDREGFRCASAKFALSLTLRAVAFGFSAEMDALGIAYNYKKGEGWTPTYTLWKEAELQDDSGGLRPTEDCSDTQRIYSPRNTGGEASLMAYDSDDPTVPFQMSGYNSSFSAFKLADGLSLGYDYQIVTVGTENYVLYTIGRENPAGAADRPMLVLSRLVSTGGMDSVGLVNPLDDIIPTENSKRDTTPYILVDTKPDGKDDGTGDLEFSVWADGDVIRAAWVSYAVPGGGGGANPLREASENTVVKTAAFDTTKKEGFSAAETVSGAPGKRVMTPAVLDENVTAWVKAEPMSAEERAAAADNYAAVLAAAGTDPYGSAETANDRAASEIGRYRLATQETIWDGSGKYSSLCIAVKGGQTVELSLPDGQTVDNIEFTRSGDTYYAAFTTRETRFTDAQGNALTTPDGAQNILTIRKLILTSFRVSGGRAEAAQSVLLRTLYDYENNETLSDGIYIQGAVTAYEEPYFANLQFLHAALGDALTGTEESFDAAPLLGASGAEDFLLFEMNGCTYVIRQSSLESITSSDEHTGTIIPFFAVDTDLRGELENGATSATGRAEVTIGADGEGGLAAVYVGNVPNTTNNALFMSRYDQRTGTWSKGVILAMNHMDVYEDAIAAGWEPEEAERAYLHELDGYDKGGMDQFTFTAPRIALGVRGLLASGLSSSDGDGSQTTLLILTQGNMSYLRRMEDEDFLGVDDTVPADPNRPRGTGIYAISYGVGHQTVGEANLSFMNYDFTAGAELQSSLSFTNTGDISIRGSDDTDQAITVTLSADGEDVPDTKLISWTITENIVPGQKVELAGDFVLPATLPKGARFNLTVSEGSYYADMGGMPYTATLSGILTVEEKPELGFEDGSVTLAGLSSGAVTVDEDGNMVLDVDFMVGNRGNADAEDVFVQFTCDSGVPNSDGAPLYIQIDISDNNLTVGEEEQLANLMGLGSRYGLTDGVLELGSIRKGYGRRVQGTLTIPPSLYLIGLDSTLYLRIEIFSAADGNVVTVVKQGPGALRTESGTHGEYNSGNNVFETHVSAAVSFLAADQLQLSTDSLTRLPIRYISSAGDLEPDILVAEYPDNEDVGEDKLTRFRHMDQSLKELWFEPDSFENGVGSGTLVIRGAKEGSGYIRLMDQNTNSYLDIPFTVTGEGAGTDVGPDNGRFTFYNANGSVWNPAFSGQDWTYVTNMEKWGTDIKGNVDDTRPFRGTLLRAKQNTSFTFETQAEGIAVYCDGQVEVTSDFPGFQPAKAVSKGGDPSRKNPAFFYLGDNPNNISHKVTIRVASGGNFSPDGTFQNIDRIVEFYHGDSAGEPANDNAPVFFWGNSFPKKGSLDDSYSYYIAQLYVIGSAPITGVTVKGSSLSGTQERSVGFQKNPNAKQTVFSVVRNGEFTVDAVDSNGNHTIQTVIVDWWPEDSGSASLMGDRTAALMEDGIPVQSQSWMTTGVVRGDESYISVRVDGTAPYEDVLLLSIDVNGVLSLADAEEPPAEGTMGGFQFQFAERGKESRIPVAQDGLYIVVALDFNPDEFLSDDLDSEYAYTITNPDGTERTLTASDAYSYDIELVEVITKEPFNDPGDHMSYNPGDNPGASGGAAKETTVSLPAADADIPGAVSVDNASAAAGDAVTVTVTPETGYRAAGVAVLDADGNPVAVTRNSDGTYSFAMPETAVRVQPVFTKIGTLPDGLGADGETVPIGSFLDVDPEQWYAAGILFCLNEGLMNGVSADAFAPDGAASRAMVVTMLWRLEGEKEGAPSDFGDVPEGAWYESAVDWANETGIVKGMTETTFEPDRPVTREQLATILYRYAVAKGWGFAGEWDYPLPYTDAGEISGFAREAMAWMTMNGIVGGMGDGALAPGEGATRAQIAAMFQRFCDWMTK